jgi:hypothetical protein
MIRNILGAIALLFLVFGPYFVLDKPFTVRYNCDIAEFHPDFPVAVREECRKVRSHK